ncbi:hypothetical protein C8F04DRAFT_1045172 [Mycena alexandri]|uniref:F-box domain-containing protein n=1 Tax=Mycena alexandri TaxID=1745969 RepID=A0AAD6WVN0_9AGAR|nr:hypothetical protein C8F04DRAFT_1045172 [Mycena alexandri]
MSIEELEARIEQLSADISLQKDVLQQLERSKSAAQRQLNALRDPLSQLPLEISSEIFRHCLPHGPRSPKAGMAPQLLMNICSGWTNIALSNPILWNEIDLESPGAQVLRLWVERAGDRPLSILLRGALDAPVAKVLEQYATRIRHFEIYGTEYSDVLNSNLSVGSFCCLRTLKVGTFVEDKHRELHNASVADVMALLRLAPNLVECTIDTFVARSYHAKEELVLPSLTRAEFLEEQDGDVLRHLTLPSLNTLLATYSDISNQSLLLLFQRSSPPLQILSLGHQGAADFIALEMGLRLVPSLTQLDIRSLYHDFAHKFLTSLADSHFLPNLRILKIRHPLGTFPHALLLPALSARRTQLVSFYLGGSSRYKFEVDDGLRALIADGMAIEIGTKAVNLISG